MTYKVKIFKGEKSEDEVNEWLRKHPRNTIVSIERKNMDAPIQSGLNGHENHWIETVVTYYVGEKK